MRSLLTNLLPRRAAASFNKPDAANRAIAFWLTIEDQWRRVADAVRYCHMLRTSHAFLILTCSVLVACTRRSDETTVTPQFLLSRGFTQSPSDPTLYELKNITVGEAAQRLGFNPKDMTHGTNNPPDQDIRGIVVRDYEFAMVSAPQPASTLAQHVLDNTNAICTVEARLIPQSHRATRK